MAAWKMKSLSASLRFVLRIKEPRIILQGLANYCSKATGSQDTFDTRMLDVLACPLSKKPLRYDASNNELVCDELGVAYPIVNGIPNLNPQDGRMIKTEPSGSQESS